MQVFVSTHYIPQSIFRKAAFDSIVDISDHMLDKIRLK